MSNRAVKGLSIAGGAVGLALVILYTGGFLATGKIPPGLAPAARAEGPPAGARVIKAEKTSITEYYRAVGTIRPRTEIKVEAQVSGRVLKVEARAGGQVKKGSLLVLLDGGQYRAKLGQAKQGLAAAGAASQRAESEYRRVEKYLAGEAATQRDLEQAREARLAAAARVRQAKRQVEEALIALGHTRVEAPEDGQVVKRLVEPGDLALPGRPLMILQNPRRLRLEAQVREGLITRVKMGQTLKIEIPALNKTISGEVSEIAPSADPLTRTFLVKVCLPPGQGLHSGMFGRLLAPVGRRRVVLIPRSAVMRVGQLEMVRVKRGERWEKVFITTGREHGGRVEVLSGLEGGEELLAPGQGDA